MRYYLKKRSKKKVDQKQLAVNWFLLNEGMRSTSGGSW